MNKRFGALSSSTDYGKLSATFTGVLTMAATVVLFFAARWGIELTPENYQRFVAEVGNLIILAGPAVSAFLVVFGLLRKAFVAVYDSLSRD